MTSLYLEKDFPVTRNKLANLLKDDGIDTRPVFPTISKYPMWHSDCNNPISINISKNSLNLPSGHNLQEDQVDYICFRIKEHLNTN